MSAGEPGGERSPAFPWWPWEEEVRRLPASLRPLAEAVAHVVEGTGASDDPAEVLRGELDASLEEAWDVVERLHRSLDRAHGAAPEGELEEARGRLNEVLREVWVAGAQREGQTFRELVREVAHDLRSPLHSILFLTDGLFREETGSLSPAQKRQISVVHTAAAALLRMSNDVLDFSAGEASPVVDEVARAPFSADEVLADLENLTEPLVHHHRATLDAELDAPGAREGDPQVLKRILLNLTSNALEATGEGGRVRVRISGDEDVLRAVVEDDSGDADPDELARLLEGGSDSRIVQSLGGDTRGLGLVICARLARAAEGSIDVCCTGDGWTRFAVDLPFPVFEPEEDAVEAGR